MDNDKSLLPPDDFGEKFDILFDQFGISMTSLQFQDLSGSEKALITAKNIFRQISTQSNENEVALFKIIVSYVEIVTRLLRSTYYSFDERYKKALEELDTAKRLCEEVNASFNSIPEDFIHEEDIDFIIDLFSFMFVFLERIILTSYGLTNGILQKSEGKYIDEILLYRNAAVELRKMNDHNFTVSDPANSNMMAVVISMLNTMAEIHEKKAERLEEKRKEIEFLPPIDRKVFIVHGHNENILRELKDILEKSFNVDPIILTEELDNGNTLIEKFEHYGRLCAFAFVIVTPDDWIENKKRKYFQTRPNVLFELGWFCGRFGRDKVRILRQKDTPLPSDLNGLVTIDFNERLEEVFRRINRDLEAAGVI